MQEGIHPNYVEATISCACGAKLQTKTTVGDISVEVCSKCHPFYTGKMGQLRVAGRAERFQKKYNRATTNILPQGDN